MTFTIVEVAGLDAAGDGLAPLALRRVTSHDGCTNQCKG